MMDFLLRAKKMRLLHPDFLVRPSRPNSRDFQYREGDLLYIDSRIGGNSMAGSEGVWRNGEAIWCMNYYGQVLQAGFRSAFLEEALQKMDLSAPFRGPLYYEKDGLRYECSHTGTFDCFQGKETVYKGDVPVYEGVFHGGKIDEDRLGTRAIEISDEDV